MSFHQVIRIVIIANAILLNGAGAYADECVSAVRKINLYNVLDGIVSSRSADFPYTITEGYGSGFTVLSIASDYKKLLTTIKSSMTLEEMKAEAEAEGLSMRRYRDVMRSSTERSTCGSMQTSQFIDAGGQVSVVYLTSDIKAFLIVDINQCGAS